MEFGALTLELARRLGLASLQPDPDGRVQITFGSSVVDIEPIPGQAGYVLAGRIGFTMPSDDAALQRRLLEYNLLGRLATGTFFALDPDSSQLVVCARHAGEVVYMAFEADLEAFLDQLDRVKGLLRQTARQGRGDDPSDGNAIRV